MAGGEALWHVRVTLLLLGLEVSLFLSAWSLDEHSQHHSPPEVVIPLRVSGTGESMKASGWLSYSLHFGGQRHIVHMKVKKSFLARNLPVFTYTDQGALLEDQPFIPNDCYYHGYLEEDPESLVILSSCFEGFHGILQVKDITYEIRPKIFSDTFEHLVYKMDSEETQIPQMRCGLTEEEIERQLKVQGIHNYTLRQSAYEGWWTHQWTIEFVMVVENTRFRTLQNNETLVEKEVFTVMNVVTTFYQPMEVDIALYGIEIWTEANVLPLEKMESLLQAFCKWKQNSLVQRVNHDMVNLIVDKDFIKYRGLAFVGTVCLPRSNCAILSFLGKIRLSEFSVITGHEMGHILGMKHDDKGCSCGRRYCIMFPSVTHSNRFTNCSYVYFWDTNVKRSCLRNSPNLQDILMQKRCGNLVVEEGEACDCGSLKSCEKDPCCLPNCTLRPGAVCAFGLCCQNCSFTSAGKVCRAEVNKCDLPEWCNGSSYHCPEDVYVQEGMPCAKDSYCFEKRCSNRDAQCRRIFGKYARSANESCYKEMNTKGDRFGHCGIKNNQYVKCSSSDILCGRVQCENVSLIPVLGQHSTVHRTPLNEVICWGTDYHHGMSIPDIGDVKDGTECGREHICFNRKCVNITTLEAGCTDKTCNYNGVCNNKQHCHCNYGRAPPDCLQRGKGGSVDSGPPPHREMRTVHKILMGFLLFFLIPLIVLFSSLILLSTRQKQEKIPEEVAPPPAAAAAAAAAPPQPPKKNPEKNKNLNPISNKKHK